MKVTPLTQKRALIYVAILLIGLALMFASISDNFKDFIKIYSFVATLCSAFIIGFIFLLNTVVKINSSNNAAKKIKLLKWAKYALCFVLTLQALRLIAMLI